MGMTVILGIFIVRVAMVFVRVAMVFVRVAMVFVCVAMLPVTTLFFRFIYISFLRIFK